VSCWVCFGEFGIRKVVVVSRLNVANVERIGLFRRKTLEIVRLDGRIASAGADLARFGQAWHFTPPSPTRLGILLKIHLRRLFESQCR
jgi:hypothetical protein